MGLQLTPVMGWLVVCLSVASSTGCSTHYSGRKLDTEGTLSKCDDGVPFMMTKPVFAVVKEGTDDAPTYKIDVKYVPDPTQRYTLNISPSLLSHVEFGMTLGTSGQLSDASASSQEQITPTLTALAAVASKVAAAAAGGPNPKSGDSASTPKPVLPPDFLDCVDKNTPKPKTETKSKISTLDIIARCAMEQPESRCLVTPDRIKENYGEGKPFDSKEFASTFFVRAAERECMANAAIFLETYASELRTLAKVPRIDKSVFGAVPFNAKITKLEKDYDSDGAARLLAFVKLATMRGAGGEQVCLQATPVITVSDRLNTHMRAVWGEGAVDFHSQYGVALCDLHAPLEKLASDEFKVASQLHTSALTLEATAKLDGVVWRARVLAAYDKRIAHLRSLAAGGFDPISKPPSPGNPGAFEPAIDHLETERADFLGQSGAYARLQSLKGKIATVPPLTQTPNFSTYDEYAKMRAESDRLQTQIETAAEKLAASAKSKSKAFEPKTPDARMVPSECVEGLLSPAQIKDYGSALADYIVVLRRDPAVIEKSSGNKPNVEDCL